MRAILLDTATGGAADVVASLTRLAGGHGAARSARPAVYQGIGLGSETRE